MSYRFFVWPVFQGIAINAIVYWSVVGFYSLLPLLFPQYARKYKRQSTTQRFSTRTTGKLVGLAMFNITVVTAIPLIFLSWAQYQFLGRAWSMEFPPWYLVLFHFVCYLVIFDTLFYFGHRLMHTRMFFRRFHSIHHRFKAPVPYCAVCVHPVEFLLCYFVPNVTAAFLLGFSAPEVVLFTSLEYAHTVHDHCGYDYPWDPFRYLSAQSVRTHDDHHRLINVNFSGAFTMFWDWMLGTLYRPAPATPKQP